ncbi:tetratricopeptide repeat protein, partial [candidate division WOR-3 bacterium]|nr:tetratricopeptide repeat protein [candidate division WOR-3 bacterium]MBD3364081.1 tetratricopeptide repeat protein [candidate division WOR-3 bacterium]
MDPVLQFLVTTVAGFIIGKGLEWGEKKLKKLLGIKISGKEWESKSQENDYSKLADLLEANKNEFTALFKKEFRKWKKNLTKEQQGLLKELKQVVGKIEILPDEIISIVEKTITSPFDLFIDLGAFFELVDKELGETEHYIPRADELEILDKFLDSDARLLLIFGKRGVGKTRLLIEYARRLEEKGKAYRFCSKLGKPTDREYASAIEECCDGEGLVILSDEIETLDNRKSLLDFLLDTNRLDIDGDFKIIGCTVYPEQVAREDLHQWTTEYELGRFDRPEGLVEVAKQNFPEDAAKVNLEKVARLCEGFPDTVIAIFHLLGEGVISLDEVPDRDEVLNIRFGKMYEEAGNYKAALSILAFTKVIWDDERKLFDDFYSEHGPDTFARALNNLQSHVAQGKDRDGEQVRIFRSRELFAIYLIKRFFLEQDAEGNLTALAKIVAKTWSAVPFLERLLVFQDDERYKAKCDLAISVLLEEIQKPSSHTEALVWAINTLDEHYARRGNLRGKVNWEQLQGRIKEIDDPKNQAIWLHQIGLALQKFGELELANFWFKQSFRIMRELGDNLGIAIALGQLGSIAQNQGDYEEARSCHEEAKKIFAVLGKKRHLGIALHQLGNISQKKGDYTEARKLYNQSLEIKKGVGDRSGIALTLDGLGLIAQQQGDYTEALCMYVEAKKTFEELGKRGHVATVLNQLGSLAYSQGDYNEAHRMYLESKKLEEELGDKSGIAKNLIGLGNIAHSQGNYEEARRLYELSLELKKELGDRSGIALSLQGLGNVALSQGVYNEARSKYEEAKKTFEELGERGNVANILHQLGNISYFLGNFEEARNFYEQSLGIKKELDDKTGVAQSLGQLGNIARAQGNLIKAKRKYEEAKEIFEEIEEKGHVAVIYHQLGIIAQVQGDYKEARRMY